jgi:hypothetical protein
MAGAFLSRHLSPKIAWSDGANSNYLYLTLNPRIIPAKIKVMPLAMIIGISLLKIPYINHRKVPVVKIAYMESEMPEVFFVLMVFTAWGKKEIVVQNAAARPSRVTNFITLNFRATS